MLRERETILHLRERRALPSSGGAANPAPLQPGGLVSSLKRLNFGGFIPHLAEELWMQEALSRAVPARLLCQWRGTRDAKRHRG